MKKNSFTLIELLVVIAILAILSGILAPAIMTAWSRAYINEAKTEIAGLASIGTMIKLDTGYYVRLRDYDRSDTYVTYVYKYDLDDHDNVTQNTASAYFDTTKWDGPYTTYQPDDMVSSTSYSSSPTADHTPKDPWGEAYQLEYSTSDEVMVIYSNGPDGEDDTSTAGGTIAGDDDIIYKFK